MREACALFTIVLTFGAWANPCLAQADGEILPTGIYFNTFTGPFSGTEWFQVTPLPGENRFRMADIFDGGFNSTVTADGSVALDGGAGTGMFSDPDVYSLTVSLGPGVFTFDNNRVPFTTPDFPLTLDSAVPADTALNGDWVSLTERIDPFTGAVITSGVEDISILAFGNIFRITDPGGLFFQGVFETPEQVVFRVVVPTPVNPDFATFLGSAINFEQNMLGEAIIDDVNHFTATILLQTRVPLGQQTQSLFRFTAERKAPLLPADINGDGAVNFADLLLVITAWGPCPGCPEDIDGDDVVGFADLLEVLSGWS